jgi:glycerol kinase
VEVAGAAI